MWESKLYRLAAVIAIAALVLFAVSIIEELIPAELLRDRIDAVHQYSTSAQSSNGPEFSFQTSLGFEADVPATESVKLQQGDSVLLALTPWTSRLKAWKYLNESRKEFGNMRPEIIAYAIIAIALAILLLLVRRFEIRLACAFFLITMIAVQYWYL